MPKLFTLVAFALAVACNPECLQAPCALPLAITLDVTSSNSGDAVTPASLQVSGAATSTMSCEASCSIRGYAGTYVLTVNAPGYLTATRSVTVLGSAPGPCQCGSVDTEHVSLALIPAT
jgi:hypothetical protein